MTHYETLDVPVDADADTIKHAYRRQAARWHTDRPDGDHERMQAINAAYEVLSDPERRAAYDAGIDDDQAQAVREYLTQLFVGGVNSFLIGATIQDFIAGACNELDRAITELHQRRTATACDLDKLQVLVGRVSSARARNTFEEVVHAKLEELQTRQTDLIEQIQLLEAVRAEATQYRDKAADIKGLVWSVPDSPARW